MGLPQAVPIFPPNLLVLATRKLRYKRKRRATLQQHLEQIQQHHPEATIQLWAFDEHR